ncbi:GntR family transcriptional regulator [Clostridium sp. D2Q-14]|uniref:GntR family transcriptional regulator n=1 Tax=Anaeromonas gelatinilytica TaxID=2683194 RepID=UPI00193B3D70|nr:GntR family transcriptional regulator [Anaeromonas gelatinilytica]MBS4534251.1 GntR family transcriptional regulator [Anaeromonas gelatinilytica]
MDNLNKDSYLPYYLQIKEIIRERILNNIYEIDTLLPSEKEFCKEFNVTRATVRNALRELKKEGLICTEKGVGSIVKPHKIEQSLLQFYSFGRTLKNKKDDFISKIISAKKIKPNCNIINRLEIKKNMSVYEILRIRIFNKSPLILEASYIPVHIAPDIIKDKLHGMSIYNLLEGKYGIKIVKAREYIEPQVANEFQSKHLSIEYGSPIFHTERLTLTHNNKPIEYRNSLIRGDKFKFYTELY